MFPPMCLVNALIFLLSFCSVTIKAHVTSSTVGHIAQDSLSLFSWAMVTHVWLIINYLLFPLEQELYLILTD
jgi:hypothetical protein